MTWTKEEIQKYNQNYYLNHSEQIRSRSKNWRKTHPKYCRNYCKNNPEKHKEQNKRCYEKHRKKRLEQIRLYAQTHPKIIKDIHVKNKAKRRKLGHNYLNKPFEGSHGHHIDFECIVFIPRELHNSISHSVLKNWNMELINDKVFEWLEKQRGYNNEY